MSGQNGGNFTANLERFIDRAEVFAGIGVGELNFSNQITLKSEDGHLVVTGKNGIGQLAVLEIEILHEVTPVLTGHSCC